MKRLKFEQDFEEEIKKREYSEGLVDKYVRKQRDYNASKRFIWAGIAGALTCLGIVILSSRVGEAGGFFYGLILGGFVAFMVASFPVRMMGAMNAGGADIEYWTRLYKKKANEILNRLERH